MRVLIRFLSRGNGGVVETRERIFDGDVLTLGRATDQVITLKDPRAELEHLRIVRNGERHLLTSRAATGVLINGTVKRDAVLAIGDEIVVGANVLRWLEPPESFDAALTFELLASADPRTVESVSFALTLAECGAGRRRAAWVAGVLVLVVALLIPWLTAPASQSLAESTSTALRSTAGMPSDLWWTSGPLHSAHRSVSAACEQCHRQPFQPVRDVECLTCHGPSLHRHSVATKALELLSEQRCASCHREHNEPTTLVMRDERQCAECHASTDPEAADFATAHPQFKVSLGGQSRALLGSPGIKEQSGLNFDHRQHLTDKGVKSPTGTEVLVCANCHVPEPGGARLQPIRMQEHCERCHALSFDPRNPERTVPHGSSAKVTESLVEYYSAQYLRRYADSQRQAQPARLLRVPGVELGTAERERALRLARDEAELAARDLFERRSCSVCHAVSRSPQGEWQVTPVKLNARWMPKASFSHAAHSTDVTPCASCHAASQSSVAQDVLLPEIAVCRDCHGGDRSATATQVPSTCVTCHKFHLEANPLWQPE